MDDDLESSQTTDQHHPSSKSQLLACTFNQDGGCLAIGTTGGFSVHNLHPTYSLTVERILRGGIGQIEMLFRSNLIALVGGGPSPHSAPHRVLIWDDHIPKEIGELSFRQPVLKVKLRKDAIAVALRDRVYVYHLADLSLRDKIYTADNPYGLLSLSTHVQDMVLACPSVTTGHVRVELYGLRKTVLIEAHESTLRALTLTGNGNLLATASRKGTVIRVWDVSSAQNVYEFRRGVERASITSLAFSWDDQWLSCSSDKGTTHIFYCDKGSSSNNNNNSTDTTGGDSSSSRMSATTTSLLKTGSRLLSLSTSMASSTMMKKKKQQQQPKSVCQIRGVPHPLSCAFIGDAPNLIAVAGWDADGNGVLLISEFASHQEARRVAYHVLVKNSLHQEESEEERRRRRARGWRPSIPDTPASDQYYYGQMRISDEDADVLEQQFQTVSTDDDFCEVIVEPRKEPVIEDKTTATTTTTTPLSSSPMTTTTTTTTTTPESGDAVSDDGDSFGAAMEDNDDDDDNDDGKDSNNKRTTTTTTTTKKNKNTVGARKETIGIVNDNKDTALSSSSSHHDQMSDEKDSIITNHDSVRTEPLEEEEDDGDDDVDDTEDHIPSASAETFVQ